MLSYNAIRHQVRQKNAPFADTDVREHQGGAQESHPVTPQNVRENDASCGQDQKTPHLSLARARIKEEYGPFSFSSFPRDNFPSPTISQGTNGALSPSSPAFDSSPSRQKSQGTNGAFWADSFAAGQEPEPKPAAEVPVGLLVRTEEAVSWLAARITEPQPIADVIRAWCAAVEDQTDKRRTVPHLTALMAARRTLGVVVFPADVQEWDGWKLVTREKMWWRLPQEEDLT
jgi:hypothetical protein